MSYVVEVEEKLKEVLRNNLEDLNQQRKRDNQDFVFTGKPDLNSKKPYILISLLDNQKSGYSIGATDSEYLQRIQVTIRVGKTNEFDIDGEKKGSGYTKNYLAERCDEIVQDNQDKFKDIGDDIFILRADSSNPNSPGDTNQTSCDYILFKRRK